MSSVRRWATAVFVLAASVGFGSSVWADQTPSAAEGEDTYVLTDLSITYPFADSIVPGSVVREDLAGVTYKALWSGRAYPGEADCEISLFASDGSTVGVIQFSNDSGPTPFTPDPMPVSVSGAPASASGSCAAGERPNPEASYVFSHVALARSEVDLVVGGEELGLRATAHWMNGVHPGTHRCSASFVFPDGGSTTHTFWIDVGDGDAIDIPLPHVLSEARLSPDAPLTCTPYVPSYDEG